MQNDRPVAKQTVIKIVIIFILIGMIFKAVSMFSPAVNWDTNYYLNIGSNFIERGQLTPYMWRLGADSKIIAGSGTGYGVFILTFWLKIFGLSLFSGYMLMYIAGVFCLIVLYFFVRDWWQSEIAGLIGVAYTGLTGYFISLYYVRMDALGILAYLLVLWLHIKAVHSKKNSLHFFVGIACIAATEIHIQAILYIASLSLYYFIEEIRYLRDKGKILQLTPSIFYFSGALIAGVIYLIIHVLPDPQAYFVIAKECPNCVSAGLLKEVLRYLEFIFYNNVEMLIFALALAVAYLRRSEADKHFFILFLGYIVAQGIISPPAQAQYSAHMLPFFGLCVGGIFVKADETADTLDRSKLILVTTVGIYWVIASLFPLASSLVIKDEQSEGVAYVHQYIPHNTVVMGIPPLYHKLLDYPNFLSYDSGERYGIILRGEDYATFYEREQPQVFIGQPKPDDETFWNYLHEHHFQQVRGGVWVSESLLKKLIGTKSEPTMNFSASETEITFGDCVHLEWAVTDADRVILDGKDLSLNGTQTVCPNSSTDYTLSAYWVAKPVSEQIRIEVK